LRTTLPAKSDQLWGTGRQRESNNKIFIIGRNSLYRPAAHKTYFKDRGKRKCEFRLPQKFANLFSLRGRTSNLPKALQLSDPSDRRKRGQVFRHCPPYLILTVVDPPSSGIDNDQPGHPQSLAHRLLLGGNQPHLAGGQVDHLVPSRRAERILGHKFRPQVLRLRAENNAGLNPRVGAVGVADDSEPTWYGETHDLLWKRKGEFGEKPQQKLFHLLRRTAWPIIIFLRVNPPAKRNNDFAVDQMVAVGAADLHRRGNSTNPCDFDLLRRHGDHFNSVRCPEEKEIVSAMDNLPLHLGGDDFKLHPIAGQKTGQVGNSFIPVPNTDCPLSGGNCLIEFL
jgi:hypothetical protein